ncbi:MAG: nucleotidyltransferase domain-containing protein [Geobacteraceae bacterium]
MKREDKIRLSIAREAARIMYEDGVKEYRDAKRKAAKPFGPEKSLSLGSHLPSNAEIHEELSRLVRMNEGDVQPERLLRMRLQALFWLELFAPFRPYLVGSVLTGTVRERSDIDLHLFADSSEEVERFLDEREIPYDAETVSIRHGSDYLEYQHLYLDDEGTVVECTVYDSSERHQRPKSSITGRPMERADTKRLRELLGSETLETE